jgi:LysR family glycine cleavage system transcriptional activator
MRYQLPPLNALRAFEAAARHQSVSRAAQELSVTAGAVSRHIALLEEHLQCQLVTRQPRGIGLTERGLAYFQSIGAAFREIDAASRTVRRGLSDSSKLVVRLSTTITTEWLAPRLKSFRSLHPSIELGLTANLQPASFDTDGMDIVVGTAMVPTPDLHFDHLFFHKHVPVCSPEFLKDLVISTPADLLKQPILYAPLEVSIWTAWFERVGVPGADITGGMRLDSLALTYQAARSGAGIALGVPFYLADDLLSGDLVAPFPFVLEHEGPLNLICRKSRMGEPAIAAFRDWILDETRQTNLKVDAWLQRISAQPEYASLKMAQG